MYLIENYNKMKIKKINENLITKDQIDDLMSDIIEYFDPNIFENLGSNHADLDKNEKFIYFVFEFLLILESDLLNVLKIFNYIKSLSNKAYYDITAQKIDKNLNVVYFLISLDKNDYSKIRKDVDIKLKGKKYNI